MNVIKNKPLQSPPGLKSAVPFRDRNPWKSWSGLLSQTQDGDNAAYRQLLDEIGPFLLNFVRKRVFNPAIVEDVYQEVLITFHNARHTYDSSRPLGPWLFAVTRHSILTTLRNNRKFVEREISMIHLPDMAPEESDKGLEDELFTALKALPEINRRAVELLKIRGLSLKDAALELGITVAALKVRAHRGYVILRNRLMLSDTQHGEN